MPQYAWVGRTRTGEERRGIVEAENEALAVARLRAEQIQPTEVSKKGKGLVGYLPTRTGVPEKSLVVFTRQLATMVDAGLPLVQCLDILASQSDNKRFSKILFDVKAHIEERGATFSEALRRHPNVFDDLYVNLVHAGQESGNLDVMLNRLGGYIEKSMKLKRRVKGAMVYPISILCVAILVVVVLLTKVIPVFENMFKEFKSGALPAPTQFVINISNGFKDNWYIFFGVALGLFFGMGVALRTEKGRWAWDRFVLKIPVVGGVIRKVVVARFTRTLGTLLSSGVPILDALDIVARTAGNKVVQAGILHAREKISEGKDLAGPLGETRIFPPMVVQMIAVGEQTGAMDAMLSKIADFYDEEVDVAVGALTSLLEPLMMVFLGTVVGGLIIAMYMPIFELAGNIKAD